MIWRTSNLNYTSMTDTSTLTTSNNEQGFDFFSYYSLLTTCSPNTVNYYW